MKKILILFICFLAVLGIVTTVYASDYYHAIDIDSISQQAQQENISYVEENGLIEFIVENSDTAIIFYPGGKVEDKSYEPLALEIAKQGISVIICHMPLNLAVLNYKAADKVFELIDVDHYYIAGHSLGGVMAATYAQKNSEKFDGVIMLASYSSADLSQTGLRILSIYGSNDQVMNKEKYEENFYKLGDCQEYIIDGGCHGYFGSYGSQDKDGIPTITAQQQWSITAQLVSNFVRDIPLN